MAKTKRVYWDSCAWLGLLNGEPDKRRELEIIYNSARDGIYELWTSTYSQVEVYRYKFEENTERPWSEANTKKIEQFFLQPFIRLVPVDLEIGRHARQIYRETPGLKKRPDAVHLASALRWPVDAMHTYDRPDLLVLSYKFVGRSGNPLLICKPNEESDGPLFGRA